MSYTQNHTYREPNEITKEQYNIRFLEEIKIDLVELVYASRV